MKTLTLAGGSVSVLLALLSGTALAKLPALSDEAKAKAAETAAKTAWTNKVADYQLCKSQDKVAAAHVAQAKKDGKPVTPVATPACADPGPFVYVPPVAASGAAPATAPAPAAAAAPAPAPVAKK
jgi:hypothetical protein